ncbi:MAG TPA: hypothetical protein VJK72_03270 [Candidatus Nanoarchaeia archaeon]|nr:hypothetical protein [Candidatus Nanoarchaeia archaeon]
MVRLTDKKMDEVVRSICGADVISLVSKIKGKENVSEFKLAEILKEDIKKVRNTLYRLYGANLVEFTRKKDKKKGWYIYYWTFKQDHIRHLYKKMKMEELDRLKSQVNGETGQQYFICVNNCVRMDFEQAVNLEYRCPECGELAAQEQKEKKVENFAQRIVLLQKEIKSLI